MKYKLFPIGFHIGPGGNAVGLMEDFLAPLDGAGIRFCLKSVDAYPLDAVMLARASGIPHTIVWRSTRMDVPNYDLPPVHAADEHYDSTIALLPPEFDKELVWLEPINEVDKNRSEWLAEFSYRWAIRAMADGYKSAHFGWSSGEPEPEHWELPKMAEFLRLVGSSPTKLAIALHEYSYNRENILEIYPWLVGRYRFLFSACDKMGIPRPTTIMTEWGWEYQNVPAVPAALDDINTIAREYVAQPQIIGGGLWYLGPGFGGIADDAQKIISPLGQMALSWPYYIEHEWPPAGSTTPPPTNPPGDEVMFDNWSFEDGTYKWNNIDEINAPVGWGFWHAKSGEQNPIDPNPWSAFVRPEVVNPAKSDIPEHEHETFFLHGDRVLKIFKGSGSIRFALSQDVDLAPGTYAVTMPIFADLVKGYTDSGQKIWADDPNGNDGLVRIHVGNEISEWESLTPGVYNYVESTVSLAVAETVAFKIEIMLPFALVQNGIFADAFTIVPVDGGGEPPTGEECIETAQFTKYHILRPRNLTTAQWEWLATAMTDGIDLPGLGKVAIGYEGWSHLDAMGAIKLAVQAGFTNSRLVVVDGHLIGDGLDADWMQANCPLLAEHTVYLRTEGAGPAPGDPVIHDIVEQLPTHPSKDYGTRSRANITTIVVHHTTGDPYQPIENIAAYHVNGNGWPGIAYHFVIDGGGKIYMTNYVETVSYHSNNANPYGVAVCMQGNFTSTWPSDAQLESCLSLVNYLKREIPTISDTIPHRDASGSATACPGNTYAQWWRLATGEDSPVEPPAPIGKALLGLHASADGGLTSGELDAFKSAKIELVKILSGMGADHVTALANALPGAPFIIRAFLHFGGRQVSPQQFFDWTVSDVRRAVDRLKDRRVIIELHNEPNLYAEGAGTNWVSGLQYAGWARDLLRLYRAAFAGYEFAFPGLSPGGAVAGIRYDSTKFLSDASAAINEYDHLAVHAYWAANWPMSLALETVDAAIAMYPGKSIIVTEASNNKPTTPQDQKAREYVAFANALKGRPPILGVTYFVASASNPSWGWASGSGEVWVGTSIPQIIGQR